MDVDWPTGVITVYKTDIFMSFVGGTVYNMDTDGFRLALKDAEDNEDGIIFPKTHSHNTSVSLGGIQYARVIEILSPYTITFDDTGGAWVCNLNGSNNNILDVTNLTSVQVRSNNSAGLINVVELQHGIFGEEVHYDADNGVAGTIYPIGTPLQPGNNFPDLVTIAGVRGFKQMHLVSDAVLDTGDDVSGFALRGDNAARTSVTINSGAVTTSCEVLEAAVTGTLDGGTILRNCLLTNLNYVNGFVYNCMLNPGTISLGGTSTAHFLNCYSGVPGVSTPIIDCSGDGPPLSVRNYNGGLKLTNKSGTDAVSIDLNSGQCILSPTVTAGTIVVRGVGKLIDESGNHIHTGTWNGATIVNETVSTIETVEQVWDTPIDGVVAGSYGEVIRSQAFHDGAVYIDVASGSAGTTFPLGTILSPVNNMADALTIAAANGIDEIRVAEDLTIAATDDVSGKLIVGAHAAKSQITVTSGATTGFTQFQNCTLTGTTNGWIIVRDSVLDDIAGFQGIAHQVAFHGGTIGLAGTQVSYFLDCYGGDPGAVPTEIDFNGSGPTCAIRGYSGDIKLVNKTGTHKVEVNLQAGQVILDTTVTNGTIIANGNGSLEDTSGTRIDDGTWNTGVTIVNDTVNTEHITAHVWANDTAPVI